MIVLCDNCGEVVVFYYNCYECPDYDLCETCFTNARHLHSFPHNFIFIKQEIPDGCFMEKNQGLRADEGRYMLIFQDDGNLCIYERGLVKIPENVIWQSETSVESVYNNKGNLQLLTGGEVVKEIISHNDVLIRVNGLKAIIADERKILWSPDYKGENVAIAKIINHPGFSLIFVDDNGNMTLVSPQEHQQKILEKGYKCISHFWGPSPPKWEDHHVENVHWGVYVREEKREKLLQIFKYHKGYFWMDVFCTNQEAEKKALDIMGDIYSSCTECICLIDGVRSDINREYDINEYPQNFRVNNHLEAKDYHDLYGVLYGCRWMTRVWTLQEAMLPREVYFTCESVDISGIYMLNLRDMEFDFAVTKGEFSVARLVSEEFADLLKNKARWTNWPEKKFWLVRGRKRSCFKKEDYFYGTSGLFGISIPNNLSPKEAMMSLLEKMPNTKLYPIMSSDLEILKHGKAYRDNSFEDDAVWEDAGDAFREWSVGDKIYTTSPYARRFVDGVADFGVLEKKNIFVGDMKCVDETYDTSFPDDSWKGLVYDLVKKLDDAAILYILEHTGYVITNWKDKYISITKTHIIITTRNLEFEDDRIVFNTIGFGSWGYICDFTENKLIKPYGTFLELSNQVEE